MSRSVTSNPPWCEARSIEAPLSRRHDPPGSCRFFRSLVERLDVERWAHVAGSVLCQRSVIPSVLARDLGWKVTLVLMSRSLGVPRDDGLYRLAPNSQHEPSVER